MAREVDFDNLNDGDIEYLRARHWLVEEAELQGHEGLRETVENWESPEADEEEEEDEVSYSDATVDQLKAELTSRGLSTEGKKAELVARLEEDDAKDEEEED